MLGKYAQPTTTTYKKVIKINEKKGFFNEDIMNIQ
jgi:hypothetical protein